MTELELEFGSLDSQGQQCSFHDTRQLWQRAEPSFCLGLWKTSIQVLKIKSHFPKTNKQTQKTTYFIAFFLAPKIGNSFYELKNCWDFGRTTVFRGKTNTFEKTSFKSLAGAWFRNQPGRVPMIHQLSHRMALQRHLYSLVGLEEGTEKHLQVWVWSLCNSMWRDLTSIVQAQPLPNNFSFIVKGKGNQCFLRTNRFYRIL